MKISVINKWALVPLLMLGFLACKKDNPTDDNTQPGIKLPDSTSIQTKVVNLSIADLRDMSTEASVIIDEDNKIFRINGIVISDHSDQGKNIDPKSVVLQQGDNKFGIVVRFASDHSFVSGDKLQIGISRQKLEQIQDEIVLVDVPLDSVSKVSSGEKIMPRITTVEDIKYYMYEWNGTLVKIAAKKLTGSNGKFEGTLSAEDESGAIGSQIYSGATFVGSEYPAIVKSLTGIVRIDGNGVRLDVRRIEDVEAGVILRPDNEYFDLLESVNGPEDQMMWDFSTAFGAWYGMGNAFWIKASKNLDPVLTTTGKNEYLYALTTAPSGFLDDNNSSNGMAFNVSKAIGKTAGLKEVTVYFARSAATQFPTYSGSEITIPAYRPSAGVTKISIYPAFLTEFDELYYVHNNWEIIPSLLVESPASFNEVGKWSSLTYKIPSKEQLIDAGVSADMADRFVAAPSFVITNTSTGGTYMPDVGGVVAPVIFDRVDFKY